MYDDSCSDVQGINKEYLIDILTEELPVLRAKIGLSQDELSSIIGISRQTYSAIETKKRRMSWKTYLSIILVFDNNDKTKRLLESLGVFPENLKKILNTDRRSGE